MTQEVRRITSISSGFCSEPGTVTVGTFDGVHIGHKKLLKTLDQISKNNNTIPTVLTFFPHPRMVLQKDIKIKLINTIDERLNLLEKANVGQVVVHPFDREFSCLSAEDYVAKILVEKLNAKCVIVGYDHRFGKSRIANNQDLMRFGKIHGFEVVEVEAQESDNINVSSTKIRIALEQGNIKTANRYLGYPFSFRGKVVHGKRIGEQINFPTANVQLTESYKILPKNGVYSAMGYLNGKKLYGMLNIGKKPTIDDYSNTIEVHWFDFQEDIYGMEIEVFPHTFIRDQKRFSSLKDLKDQLRYDKSEIIKNMGVQTYVRG